MRGAAQHGSCRIGGGMGGGDELEGECIEGREGGSIVRLW